jgi:glutathione peroxidase
MRLITSFVAGAVMTVLGLGAAAAMPAEKDLEAKWKNKSFYSLSSKTLAGDPAPLSAYEGKVTLVVNVASQCGLTPQYEGLEKLYRELKDKDFVIIGFPSNDFGGQEPGTAEEIKTFCTSKYDVTFPMMEKVQTTAGDGQSEIYEYLGTRTSKLPSWNFAKYVIGRDGQTITFFDSRVKPGAKELREAIDKALEAPKPAKDESSDKAKAKDQGNAKEKESVKTKSDEKPTETPVKK